PRHLRRDGEGGAARGDSVPRRSGGGDHGRAVHGFQRNGRRSDAGQGQGAGVGLAVRASDVRRIGLSAAEGVLASCEGRDRSSVFFRLMTPNSQLQSATTPTRKNSGRL